MANVEDVEAGDGHGVVAETALEGLRGLGIELGLQPQRKLVVGVLGVLSRHRGAVSGLGALLRARLRCGRAVARRRVCLDAGTRVRDTAQRALDRVCCSNVSHSPRVC